MNNIPGKSVVREFEYKVARYCDVEYALSVCNATIGILGVFYSLGLAGSEIITTPLTWQGALSGLLMLDCKLKFCDVESDTLTLNPEKLESCITPKTKAVFTADFLGYPARLDEIKAICDKYHLWLIHDAASSFGSRYKERFSGTYADITIFSFGAKKLFSIGEGGCIVTNKSEIYGQLISWLSHPEKQSIEITDSNPFSLNTNMNPFAAQYGLKTFEEQLERIAKRYIRTSEWLKEMGIHDQGEETQPNYYRVLLHPKYTETIQKNHAIVIEPLPFGKLVYQEPTFINFQTSQNIFCPVAEFALREFLTIKINK